MVHACKSEDTISGTSSFLLSPFKGQTQAYRFPKQVYWPSELFLQIGYPYFSNVHLILFFIALLYYVSQWNVFCPGNTLLASGFEWSRQYLSKRISLRLKVFNFPRHRPERDLAESIQFHLHPPEYLHMSLTLPDVYICVRSFWLRHLRKVSGFCSTDNRSTCIQNLTPWQTYLTLLFTGITLSTFKDVLFMNYGLTLPHSLYYSSTILFKSHRLHFLCIHPYNRSTYSHYIKLLSS